MVCPTMAFATWDSTNLCVVLSFIVRGEGFLCREEGVGGGGAVGRREGSSGGVFG